MIESQGEAFAASPGSVPGGSLPGGQRPSASERVLLTGWDTADSIRAFQTAWRVRDCGQWVSWKQQNVLVREGDTGWSFGHLHRCGSPWACPVCAHQIATQRGSEVAQAVEWWRSKDASGCADVVLLTLTVRHKDGYDLKRLRQAVSHAWRVFQQGRTWRAFRKACGVEHLVRCHEVTWGENGWHPHLHVLMFCRNPEVPEEYFARNEQTEICTGMLVDEWRRVVCERIGDHCLPNRKRALDIDACDDETYITRMGLEVGGPGAKHAQDGHLTAMELARELATADDERRPRLAALWREYTLAMHGAHQVQWSRGLKKALGVAESDGSIVERVEHEERRIICEIPGETWRDMAQRVGVGPIAAVGRKHHGMKEHHQLRALLAFFRKLEGCECTWRIIGGRRRLQWVPGSERPPTG